MTDNVPIAYTDAGGNARPLAAQQTGSLYSFQSVPTIDGVPVRAATPMPVTDAAAEASLATIAAQDTLSATAAGTPADAAYAGLGPTSMIGGLKGIFAKLGAVALATGGNVIGAVTQSGPWALSAGSALIGGVRLIDTGGTNAAAISAAGRLSVDPSGVTSPVTGTVTANAGTGTFSVTDAANGPVSAGVAATKSELGGAVYNSSLPSLSTGQQVADQCDINGRRLVASSLATPVSATASPAVTASAYAAGNCVGGLVHLANFFPTSKGGIITGVRLVVNGADTAANLLLNGYVFNASPSSSTITDKSAISIVLADWPKIAYGFSGNTSVTGASGYPSVIAFYGSASPSPVTIVGTDIWFAMVTAGTPTFSATTDVTLLVEGVAY
jgi:hypothetical protein